MAASGEHCAKCGHHNPAGARFCNSCGVRLEEAHPAPAPAPMGPVTVPASALPVRKAREEHEAFHHTRTFYGYVFIALGIITIVEIFLTQKGPPAFWVTALLGLSAIKFALVAMFFMHLFGDRRVFQIVFVGPLLLAAAIGVTLVGLFRNF